MKEVKDKSYYGHVRPEMLQFVPSTAKKIIEIGCGEANFSNQLINDNVEVWGVEPNLEAAKVASNKLFKVLTGTIGETIFDLPEDYFDVIILNDVIEHLIYPEEDLKKLKPKLNKGGILVSSIPNVRYSKNIFNLIFKRDWKYTASGILDNTHFRFFTKKSIQRMFKECGFTIQTIKGVNRTKSFLYYPFAVIFNTFLLFSQLDMFYMQFAIVSKKEE